MKVYGSFGTINYYAALKELEKDKLHKKKENVSKMIKYKIKSSAPKGKPTIEIIIICFKKKKLLILVKSVRTSGSYVKLHICTLYIVYLMIINKIIMNNIERVFARIVGLNK